MFYSFYLSLKEILEKILWNKYPEEFIISIADKSYIVRINKKEILKDIEIKIKLTKIGVEND